ncbi:MAG: pilus assembly protein Flp/PilA [Nocardioidaceae bacterium]|jgi:pilus assembly protein Flp/PilA|nr:pilus assembly protein Flp/PilA [Nocardioidaceae bacterium]
MRIPEPWSRLWRDRGPGRRSARRLESGASAVEYGLLIAGIAAIIAVAIFAFGGGATGMFQDSCKTIFADRSAGSCN